VAPDILGQGARYELVQEEGQDGRRTRARTRGPDEVTSYSANKNFDEFWEDVAFGSGKVVRLDAEDDPEDYMTEAELASYAVERQQAAESFAEDDKAP
jgi:hypothetical protein